MNNIFCANTCSLDPKGSKFPEEIEKKGVSRQTGQSVTHQRWETQTVQKKTFLRNKHSTVSTNKWYSLALKTVGKPHKLKTTQINLDTCRKVSFDNNTTIRYHSQWSTKQTKSILAQHWTMMTMEVQHMQCHTQETSRLMSINTEMPMSSLHSTIFAHWSNRNVQVCQRTMSCFSWFVPNWHQNTARWSASSGPKQWNKLVVWKSLSDYVSDCKRLGCFSLCNAWSRINLCVCVGPKCLVSHGHGQLCMTPFG